MIWFDSLAGVPVHWGQWGSTGRRKLHRCFHAALESAMRDLWARCPWGAPDAILSGGAWVDKPGRHRLGTAFDLSGIRWSGQPVFECRLTAGCRDWKRYLAIESVLRRHLPQVLNWWQPDKRHKDHWHVDDRPVAGFQSDSHADVSFVQACLFHLWGYGDVEIDGRYGPVTHEAVMRGLSEVAPSLSPGDSSSWDVFLRSAALAGFGLAELE